MKHEVLGQGTMEGSPEPDLDLAYDLTDYLQEEAAGNLQAGIGDRQEEVGGQGNLLNLLLHLPLLPRQVGTTKTEGPWTET